MFFDVHRVIVKHFKKFRCNQNGALVMMRDISDYRDKVAPFNSQAVNARFAAINDLSKLLFVSKEYIKTTMSESPNLLRLDRAEVLSFLQIRSDYERSFDNMI